MVRIMNMAGGRRDGDDGGGKIDGGVKDDDRSEMEDGTAVDWATFGGVGQQAACGRSKENHYNSAAGGEKTHDVAAAADKTVTCV